MGKKPETCRYCTMSLSCDRRQDVHFAVFGDKMYNATPDQTDKLESLLADTCTEEREEVYHRKKATKHATQQDKISIKAVMAQI